MLDNLGPNAIISPLKCSLAALPCADPAMQTQPPNPHPPLGCGCLLCWALALWAPRLSQEGEGKEKEGFVLSKIALAACRHRRHLLMEGLSQKPLQTQASTLHNVLRKPICLSFHCQTSV